MNKNLIKILAFIGAATLLIGCVPTPVDYSSDYSAETSTEESQKPSSRDLVETFEEENNYLAVVIYNGDSATIYDDFDGYTFGHRNSKIYIYYNKAYSVADNVTAILPEKLVFTNYFFYDGYGTREALYAFVRTQVEEDVEIIYYTEQANTLARGN